MHDDDASRPETTPDNVVDRARSLFERAAPKLRDVNAAIERHGLDVVRDDLVGRAGDVAKRVSDRVANASAIEGTVVERPGAAATPRADDSQQGPAPSTSAGAPRSRALPPERARRHIKWHYVGIVVGLTVFGAAIVQHRRHD